MPEKPRMNPAVRGSVRRSPGSAKCAMMMMMSGIVPINNPATPLVIDCMPQVMMKKGAAFPMRPSQR